MTTFPGSPRLIKGGLILADPDTLELRRVVALQYNPDALTRTLQIQGIGADAGDRAETLRLKGPPVEVFKLDAEIDATDQLEFPDQNAAAVEAGIYPQLAVLESIVYPSADAVQQNSALAQSGTIEIAPVETSLTLFVWSRNRVLPVRLTEFSITEEAFDASLNPIRARVSLSLRVLSTNDFKFGHKGASLFMTYHRQKEQLASRLTGGTTAALGLTGIG